MKIESPNHATRLNIGMVHQHFKLVSNYTIAENITKALYDFQEELDLLRGENRREFPATARWSLRMRWPGF